MPTIAERQRLLAVNRAAALFYRRELLQAKTKWARSYFTRGGAPGVLDPSSSWSIGYAPDARSRLVDSLRSKGFEQASVRNAGLALIDPEGRTIDRFRDLVMMPARNEQLETVGFIGVRADPEPYYVASPASQVYRRGGALVGVAEQLDLLSEGAVPVLVNSPLDALAVERVSRLAVGRWAGIPLCDTLLSVQQAGLLARYAASDSVIVAIPDSKAGQRAAVAMLDDLNRFFVRVWAVELPPDFMTLERTDLQFLQDRLLVTRPLGDYRGAERRRKQTHDDFDLDTPDRGPAL
ncbi:hypothetical protein OHA18_41330 [Kribbella sp. NBC_00709]|uniref:hypothetical protein n=1 Tax=Kribbella sp. NBC_00709 TaxID=2975972 RepID=UPI002E2A3840|nr:hypothetical protein [Kribbella sp. NBC_00709]